MEKKTVDQVVDSIKIDNSSDISNVDDRVNPLIKVIEAFENRVIELQESSSSSFQTIVELENYIRFMIRLKAFKQIVRLLDISSKNITKLDEYVDRVSNIDDLSTLSKQLTSLMKSLLDIISSKDKAGVNNNTAIFMVSDDKNNNRVIDINLPAENLQKVKGIIDKVITEWNLYEE